MVGTFVGSTAVTACHRKSTPIPSDDRATTVQSPQRATNSRRNVHEDTTTTKPCGGADHAWSHTAGALAGFRGSCRRTVRDFISGRTRYRADHRARVRDRLQNQSRRAAFAGGFVQRIGAVLWAGCNRAEAGRECGAGCFGAGLSGREFAPASSGRVLRAGAAQRLHTGQA